MAVNTALSTNKNFKSSPSLNQLPSPTLFWSKSAIDKLRQNELYQLNQSLHHLKFMAINAIESIL
jgi:hypothetical protein